MISNQQVLKKVAAELEAAQRKSDQTQAMKEHVRSIRLLCDLLLEGDNEDQPVSKPVQHKSVSEELELRKMIDSDDVPKGDGGGSLLDF